MFPTKDWKNKKGTGDRICKCGSWKNHWINYSGQSWPIYCSCKDCYNKATLGAHLINDFVNGEFIVPLCNECNSRNDAFELKVGTIIVSANRSKTCDR